MKYRVQLMIGEKVVEEILKIKPREQTTNQFMQNLIIVGLKNYKGGKK